MSKALHTVVETPDYLAEAKRAGMTDAERQRSVNTYAKTPDYGDEIQGSGGFRKGRVAGRGKGKSGGYRVVSIYLDETIPVFLIAVLTRGTAKTSPMRRLPSSRRWPPQSNRLAGAARSADEPATPHMVAPMTDSFTRILSGAKSALAYMEGNPPEGTIVHVPEELDVAEIRTRTGLAQPAFAATIGVSLHTLRNWEQKRRRPEGPARVLLAMVGKRPQVVQEILGEMA